jgi:hypothetical protein
MVQATQLLRNAIGEVAAKRYEAALLLEEHLPSALPPEFLSERLNYLIALLDDRDRPDGWEWGNTPYQLIRQEDGTRTNIDCDPIRVVGAALRQELADAEAIQRFDYPISQPNSSSVPTIPKPNTATPNHLERTFSYGITPYNSCCR